MPEFGTFDPEAILASLDEHEVRFILIGGLAATLHGAHHVTTDVDVTPDRSKKNLEALAAALRALEARVRAESVPGGLPFDASAEMLSRVEILNLITRHGALDIAFAPSGTRGYDDLKREAVELDLDGLRVRVASLSDVIRSKEAAGRERDRLVLPSLRRLQQRLDEGERQSPPPLGPGSG